MDDRFESLWDPVERHPLFYRLRSMKRASVQPDDRYRISVRMQSAVMLIGRVRAEAIRAVGIAEDSLLARAIRRARAGEAPHERTAGRQPLKIHSPKLWSNGAGIARIPDNQGAAPNAAHRAI